MPEPRIDLSIQTFNSAIHGIINHDNQLIPYGNFGQTDTYLWKGTLIGFIKQCPMNVPECSSVYLNIVELFQESKLTDHESDHIEDLLYMAYYCNG